MKRRLGLFLRGLAPVRQCRICGIAFRRRRCRYPSLVGWAYCSEACEKAAWREWVHG
jgi:hypothetical protein